MAESLSIIIPAYNEAPRIGPSLEEVIRFANDAAGEVEIIVVDDGSVDGTAEVVRVTRARMGPHRPRVELVQHERNRGKGVAVRTGFNQAAGDIVLFSDADLSTPISEAPRLLQPIAQDQCDIAVGSRGLDPSLIEVCQDGLRRRAGQFFNRIVRWMTPLDLRDTQCGFKAFRRLAAMPVFGLQRIDGFAFDVELLYVATKLGLRVLEVPVRWSHARQHSKVSILRDGARMGGDLCRIRLNDWRCRYRPSPRPANDRQAVPRAPR